MIKSLNVLTVLFQPAYSFPGHRGKVLNVSVSAHLQREDANSTHLVGLFVYLQHQDANSTHLVELLVFLWHEDANSTHLVGLLVSLQRGDTNSIHLVGLLVSLLREDANSIHLIGLLVSLRREDTNSTHLVGLLVVIEGSDVGRVVSTTPCTVSICGGSLLLAVLPLWGYACFCSLPSRSNTYIMSKDALEIMR